MTLSLLHRFRFSLSICFFLLVIAFAPDAVSAQAKAPSPPPAQTAIVQGHVRDSVGKPLANATVTLQSTKGTDTESWNTRTDPAGAFRFVGPWSGTYTLRTGESGSSLTIVKSVELAAGRTTKVELDLNTVSSSSPSPQDYLSSAAKSPQLFDEPKFTVAGVAPPANSGGHGSDTVLRNSEALVRDTASLAAPRKDVAGKESAGKPAAQNRSGKKFGGRRRSVAGGSRNPDRDSATGERRERGCRG